MDSQIIHALDDGVVIIEKNGNIVQYNPAASELLPLQTGSNMTSIINQDGFTQLLHCSTAKTIQIHYQHKQWFAITIKPIQDCIMLMIKDITHITHLERMRKDFVANVSHELRTPLTVIQGYLEILLELDKSQNDSIQWLQQMQQQGNRMQELVEGLLKLSQLESKDNINADNEHIHVGSCVKAILATVTEMNQNLTIHHNCQDDLILQGNSQDIESVFTNLIGNAIKYSPNGGQITITWQLLNQQAIFTVQDQGLGIAKKHISRVTERFYRVDKARSYTLGPGGTGLGLAIVKHILIQHQAKLEIDSVLGEGSCFRCIFPIQRVIHIPAKANAHSDAMSASNES